MYHSKIIQPCRQSKYAQRPMKLQNAALSKRRYFQCLAQIVGARMQHPKAFCHPASFADCMKYATESTERNRNY